MELFDPICRSYSYDQAMKLARDVSELSTCIRANVGAVVLGVDNKVLGLGFNTALEGQPTCKEVGCLMHDNSCKRTVHAEVNAIYDAIKKGYNLENCIVVCTHYPCADCLKYMALHKIHFVIYDKPYTPKYELTTSVKLVSYEDKIKEV